jgi:hypothetical protein
VVVLRSKESELPLIIFTDFGISGQFN